MIDVQETQTIERMNTQDIHRPVMAQEVKEGLSLPEDGTFVDGTMGLGGHSALLAEGLGPRARIIGIDRDASSLELARQNLSSFTGQLDLVHDDFRNVDRVLDGLGVSRVDGILFDLGISSYQLDDPQRGFSLMADGPLDMRMDRDSFLSAYDLINSLSEHELSLILKKYGEERMSNRIARFLVDQREHKPLQSTKELRELVMRAMPPKMKRQKIHPATRTFQAFRIAVNRELESIELTLERCLEYLKPGGRICVISFHSLEDRIVKHKFRASAKQGQVIVETKKPLRPLDEEVIKNPRARSARLRVATRI